MANLEFNDDIEDIENYDEIKLSNTAKDYLIQTKKWTNFLAIIGFVFISLMVLGALFSSILLSTFFGDEMGLMPGGFSTIIMVVYLLISLLYFFPTWYLYKFSKKTNEAIANNSSTDFEEALRYQKSFFKFIGITTVIILCIYVLYFLVLGIFFGGNF